MNPIKRSQQPTYRLQLPLTKKRIEFQPFTMRSERTLMLATQGGDPDELTAAVINTINDHVLTEGVKAEDLPQAETELVLLNMRAKSVGEKVELKVTDPEFPQQVYDVKVDLTEIKIAVDEDYKDLITLSDGTMVKLRLPGLLTMKGLIFEEENEFDNTLKVLARCIESVVVGEDVYNQAEMTEAEIVDFLLDLDTADFKKITEEFFAKMPSLKTIVEVKRKNGEMLRQEVEGLASFL